jgi:hypothetical protein
MWKEVINIKVIITENNNIFKKSMKQKVSTLINKIDKPLAKVNKWRKEKT